ncbi:MAG TPA: endonuclease MutS2 [Candidatus Obscuribacterales bacterium]
MDILARTLRALEWERLKDYLAAEALTGWGQELCLALAPLSGTALIEQSLDETAEAASLIQSRTDLPVQALPELRGTLARLAAGGDLSALELLDLKAVAVSARQVRASLALLDKDSFPRLTSFMPSLHGLEALTAAIDEAVEEGGAIKDSASRRLGQLRRQMRATDGQVRDELARIIHSATLSKALQEPLYTQRNGRYVLPVAASMRHVIPGIVHDSSASGLTVYVEPMAVIELANKMRLLEAEIDQEIAAILTALSRAAQGDLDKIESSFESLVQLDFILARARLGVRYGGSRPEISGDGSLFLRAAGHPLLILRDDGQAPAVVRNDIALNGRQRTMVVTGPNTGGKTVLLKTAGLLALMVRAGLLLPVGPGSKAVVFPAIYADIGDEQSIEQNLSTFSSHMRNIIEVIGRAGEGSLVLLDEIGVGTDPREGAALAQAVLAHLNDSGAYTITTTHYGELKALAYSHPGFVNASLEFDEQTLSPTYRLRLGVPGSSKATTIARRLGLAPELVRAAESLLGSEGRGLSELLDLLGSRLEEVEAERQRAKEAASRAEEQERQARLERTRLEGELEALRSRTAAELAQELSAARQTIRALVAELQRAPALKHAQEVKEKLQAVEQSLPRLRPAGKQPGRQDKPLTVGQTVRVLSLDCQATVEAVPGSPDPEALVTVRRGNLRIKVPRSDLQEGPFQAGSGSGSRRAASQARPAGSGRQDSGKGQAVPASSSPFVRTGGNTLDLRGNRVEEALARLERFLDEAARTSGGPLMIIHGHGTGAIKSAVRSYLDSCAYALSFRPGELYEGGDGVTIVELA